MKHLKPVSKAQTAELSPTDIITMVVAILEALAPIVAYIIQAAKPEA